MANAAGSDQAPRLRDVASVVRSKNAGPFELCIDILFPDRRSYDIAVESPALTPDTFARLYNLAPADCKVIWFPAANAVKCTMPRAVTAGRARPPRTTTSSAMPAGVWRSVSGGTTQSLWRSVQSARSVIGSAAQASSQEPISRVSAVRGTVGAWAAAGAERRLATRATRRSASTTSCATCR